MMMMVMMIMIIISNDDDDDDDDDDDNNNNDNNNNNNNNNNNRIEMRILRLSQSPHCAADCLQHVLSSGWGANHYIPLQVHYITLPLHDTT